MRKIPVLVFPCGAENASEIHDALVHSIHVELHGASSADDHGRFTYANYHGDLPRIHDAAFNEAFRNLVRRHGIKVVFATHDSVAETLAKAAPDMGFHLINGNVHTAEITRRKSLTYGSFPGSKWIPRVFATLDAVDEWPIVVKPDLGQGGQDVFVVHGREEAGLAIGKIQHPVLVEYLPGEEITVDCFTDRLRRVIWAGPRTRERVRAGISMRSRHLPLGDEIREIADEINRTLELRGPWFFQLKRDRSSAWKLLEISCRVAGTMVAQRAKGVNLPLMAIHDYIGRDLVAMPESRVALIDRRIATVAELDYEFDSVYVDFDDTLVVDGKAQPHMMRFLYRMVELGKRTVLITRHAADLDAALVGARIPKHLFDEIVHIADGSPKSKHISGRAIFIDNYFPERMEVAGNCGIPTFDVDAVEMLAI